jgi:hypothetical protein
VIIDFSDPAAGTTIAKNVANCGDGSELHERG